MNVCLRVLRLNDRQALVSQLFRWSSLVCLFSSSRCVHCVMKRSTCGCALFFIFLPLFVFKWHFDRSMIYTLPVGIHRRNIPPPGSPYSILYLSAYTFYYTHVPDTPRIHATLCTHSIIELFYSRLLMARMWETLTAECQIHTSRPTV